METKFRRFARLNQSFDRPLAMFFGGDINAHCQSWYANGDTNEEGLIIDDLACSLGLKQLISEPINFEGNRNPPPPPLYWRLA